MKKEKITTKRRKLLHFEKLPTEEGIKQLNDIISDLLSQPYANQNDSFIKDLKQQRDDLKKKIKSKGKV
jgi:hypothetical protein